MKTIVVAGSHSNIGKTTLAERLLRGLRDWSGLKITMVRKKEGCPRKKACGVCSGLKSDFDVITEGAIINQKGTDTCRMKKAGAKKVAWLRANSRGFKEGLKNALCHLEGSKGVVIEGTSVLRYLEPDIAIYIKDNSLEAKKRPGKLQKIRT